MERRDRFDHPKCIGRPTIRVQEVGPCPHWDLPGSRSVRQCDKRASRLLDGKTAKWRAFGSLREVQASNLCCAAQYLANGCLEDRLRRTVNRNMEDFRCVRVSYRIACLRCPAGDG